MPSKEPGVYIRLIANGLAPRLDERGPSRGATIVRDLQRYYAWLERAQIARPLPVAFYHFQEWRRGAQFSLPEIDALERAEYLIETEDISLDEALVRVGLVREDAHDPANAAHAMQTDPE